MVKTDYILKNRQGNLLFRVRFVNILNIYTRPKKGMNVAISKAMRAALAILSYRDIDIKKNYPLAREFERIKSWRLKKPELYSIWEHKVCCGRHDVPVRIFTPKENVSDSVLLFFHGGGWVTGNIDSYDGVCSDMSKLTGHRVVSVDYRLAPECRFPGGLEDCYAVAKEIFSNFEILGVKPENIILIGDSAGGNLAAAVSLLARDRKEFYPSKQILIYPATAADHSRTSPFESVRENGTGYLLTSKRVRDYMELYSSSDADFNNPYFAPLLAKDFSNLPSTLIITAQYCPLRDEGEEFGHRLQESGVYTEVVRMPDAIHGYFSLPSWFEQVRKTYEIINNFLKEKKF